MEPLLTPEEMSRADSRAIAQGVHAMELMDRAAHACSVVALRELGGAYGRRVVVVSGKGNNGGDGIAAARHLATAGVSCDLFLLAEPTGDPARHLHAARALSPRGRLRIASWSRGDFEAAVRRADLVVDAVFGTGFAGHPRDVTEEAIGAIASCGVPVLAVDIPSGVSGADGAVAGVAVRARITVAIQALKVGHVTGPGSLRCGRIVVADIGIAVGDPPTAMPSAADVRAVVPARRRDAHKYSSGVLAVLAGSAGMTGAAALCALGAVRAGAGLVFIGVPGGSVSVLETAVIEAVKIGLPSQDGQLTGRSVEAFAEWIGRADALAVGPGVGRGPSSESLIGRALDVEVPVVIDADGLTTLAGMLARQPDLLASRAAQTILTPHAGEFARLAGRPSAPRSEERVERARKAAGRWGAVVHLKGRRAITAAPDGRVWINPTGNPGMASGGTGDVLTGVAGTLLAQGLRAEDAAWAGAFVHGLAGDLAARRRSEAGMTALDLVDNLASAWSTVGREVAARASSARLRDVL